MVNLGNTCFMNSGIQCLAAVAPLANYFLSGKWEDEINQNNPLGTGGRLSKAFAELIKEMWSGHESSIAPSDVKKAVGQVRKPFIKLKGSALYSKTFWNHKILLNSTWCYLSDGLLVLKEILNRILSRLSDITYHSSH